MALLLPNLRLSQWNDNSNDLAVNFVENNNTVLCQIYSSNNINNVCLFHDFQLVHFSQMFDFCLSCNITSNNAYKIY